MPRSVITAAGKGSGNLSDAPDGAPGCLSRLMQGVTEVKEAPAIDAEIVSTGALLERFNGECFFGQFVQGINLRVGQVGE